MMSAMALPANLDQLTADELRELVRQQAEVIRRNDRDLNSRQVKIDKLTHEGPKHNRHYFGVKAEPYPWNRARCSKKPLPPESPRTEIHHEPESSTWACGCPIKRIGEDLAEKLDYTPGIFTVERYIRGKWACADCETPVQAPVPPHVIDKGILTSGLLAHFLVAKYLDHLPLYRQEGIFGRAGLPIPQSTLAEWVGQMGVALQLLADALEAEMLRCPALNADETPVAMVDPGAGKTHRAYLWSYSIGAFEPVRAVVYDFADSRAGKHAREFLGDWRGTLVCDDYSGYKALIADGVTEAGCMAHARRKFFDLHTNHQSQIAQQALIYIQQPYQVEWDVADLAPDERRRSRQEQAKPILGELHDWLTRHRWQVPNGSATAKAIDYSLKRWTALAH